MFTWQALLPAKGFIYRCDVKNGRQVPFFKEVRDHLPTYKETFFQCFKNF